MLQKIYIKHLHNFLDQTVTLSGWALRVRDNGKICFLQFRDGTGFIQVVASKEDVSEEHFETMRHLERESSVKICGKVVENPKSPSGLEIIAESVLPVSDSDSYPITPKEHGTDFLMDLRHLWIRSPRQHAILTIRHQIITAIRHYFDDLDFTLVDAPIFKVDSYIWRPHARRSDALIVLARHSALKIQTPDDT